MVRMMSIVNKNSSKLRTAVVKKLASTNRHTIAGSFKIYEFIELMYCNKWKVLIFFKFDFNDADKTKLPNSRYNTTCRSLFLFLFFIG